ncbi:MAG: hypothetical protein JXR49_05425 [Acidobacteria bacterium]|nr:hypothetical protein [Acidobacteriota bacterium]
MESTQDFKDRKGLLIFFGIILLLTGGICLLFSAIMLITTALPQPGIYADPQLQLSALLIGVFFYSAMAAFFIALGIGSIQARRWARSITLLLSWLVLIAGVVSLVYMFFYSGVLIEQIAYLTKSGSMVMELVSIIMYISIIVFLIIVPGIFILVYRSKVVIQTVRKYHPEESWTDRCPLPLMAHSFFLLYMAVSPLFLISFGLVAPFFGIFIGGWPAAIVWFVNSLLCIYLAIGVYRLQIRAWHYSLYLFLLWLVSAGITLLYHDWTEVYEYSNFPAEQVALMESIPNMSNNSMFVMLLLTLVSYLIFYFYAKKYFKQE